MFSKGLVNRAAVTISAAITAEINKIDLAATDGLGGVADSLGYRTNEIERHLHSPERWWGATGAPDETNAIAATVTVPFVATSGNDTWGAAIPICGTADEPTDNAADAYFDCHRLFAVDLDDDTTPWRIRIIWGTGTSAAAISAGQWTEVMIMTNTIPGNQAGGVPVTIQMPRQAAGNKLWAQAWNNTNAEDLSFYWGAHGYEG